jgi:hypothetical protein
MTRFADTMITVTDNNRVRKIREDENGRIARQFAPVQARAAANAKALSEAKGFLAAW